MNLGEVNYGIKYKELLVIINTFNKWRAELIYLRIRGYYRLINPEKFFIKKNLYGPPGRMGGKTFRILY